MTDPRNKPIARTFGINAPAAGAGFSITPDTGGDWLIRALTFQFVTDANAATRAVLLTVGVGTVAYRVLPAGATQITALTRTYSGSEGLSVATSLGTAITIAFPKDGIWLPAGHTLSVAAESVQAGDQFGSIQGYRFEFPKGPREHYWPMVHTLLEESS